MKLKPSGGCRTFLAAFVATLASVVQLFAADVVTTWNNPPDIVYGTPLGSAQLNAVFTNSETGAQLQGNTIYSPPLNTQLNAGLQQALVVTFTPNANQGVPTATVQKQVFLNVLKATLTATAPSATVEYGQAVANWVGGLNPNMVTYSNFQFNDGVGSIQQLPTLNVAPPPNLAFAEVKAGTSLPVTFAQPPAMFIDNYNIVTVNGTLTVTKKPLVFNLADQTKQYGSAPIPSDLNIPSNENGDFDLNGGGRGIGWENNDNTKVQVSQVHSVTTSSNVGTYDIQVVLVETNFDILDNYDVQFNNGKYTVTPRQLIITVNPQNSNITYGNALPSYTATYQIAAGNAPFAIGGVNLNGNALQANAGVLTAGATLNIPAPNANVANSPHAVTTTGGTVFGGNFSITRQNGALTVGKRTLTVKAANRTKITGVPLPGIQELQILFPNAATEFVFGDGPSVMTPFPPPLAYDTVTFPALNDGVGGINIPIGVYANAIIFTQVPTAANYELAGNLIPGDLNVTAQPAQVGWLPGSQTMVYGSAFTLADHLNAVGTTLVPTGNGGATVPLPGAISYSASKDGVIVDPNLVAGDTLPVGNYQVTATFVPDLVQLGIDLGNPPSVPVYGNGTATIAFSVTKKTLNVTANNQSRVFGNTAGFVPTAVTYDGFVLGDGAGNLGTQPTVADPTNASSNVGEYTIIPSGGVSGNYAFNYKSGKLTITPAPTVSTWAPEAAGNDVSKHILYGTPLASTPNLNAAVNGGVAGTFTYSVNVNDARALTVPGQNVKATFNPSSPNFSSSSVTVFLNVKRRVANVVPQGFDKIFGDDVPGVTGTTDFLAGDGIVTTFTSPVTKGTDVGEYFITATYDDTFGRLKNYNINLSSGDANRINVLPAPFNIVTQNQSSAVGQPQAAVRLKLFGLKAEAAPLNGIAMTAAELAQAIVSPSIVIGGTTYNNAGNSFANFNLLARVFRANAANTLPGDVGYVSPVINVPNFASNVEAEFSIQTVLDTVTNDGDPTSLFVAPEVVNYTLTGNTNGLYSVGKATPNIVWAASTITYGTAIGANELDAVVTDGPLLVQGKEGTFVYRLNNQNGAPASGQILDAGTHTLHVTYTPHADNLNAYVQAFATVTLTVNKANLDVYVPALPGYVYGNPLPIVQSFQLITGTQNGNTRVNDFVNGDGFEIFEPVNGGVQPIVTIAPNQNNVNGGFTVNNSPAFVGFGQLGSAKNYNINHNNGTMPIGRRPLTIKPAMVSTTFGQSVPLSLVYDNLAPGETPENLQSPGFAFLNPQVDIATLTPGNYTIFSNGGFGSNYTVTHGTDTLEVKKATALITIANNVQVFDGTGKGVSVSTQPAGLGTIVTYNGDAALPVAAGNYQVVVSVNDPNYEGSISGTLTIEPANATITLGALSQVYDGTAKMVSTVTNPAGLSVSVTYNGNPVAPTEAGTYAVEASINDSNYSGSASGVLTIGKATAQIALLNLQQVFDGNAKTIGVQTTPAGLATEVLYDTFATAPSKVGTYTVVVNVQDNNYQGTATGKLNILTSATISITNLSQEYTGNPLSPTITTTPAGLTVNVTYNKNPVVPHEAGTYEVLVTIQDALYSGSATAVFRITKKPVGSIAFVQSSLTSPWNNIKPAQVTTDPAGLPTQITYNGSLDVPTTIGDYEVKAVIVDRNIGGEAVATFTVGKAPQEITFPALPNLTINGNALVLVLQATASSGLPITYTVARGGASISDNLLTISQPGEVVITAQQLGNEFWLPAEEKVRSFRVTGTGVPLGAAQVAASLNDDGSVNLGISGAAFQELSVYSSTVVNGEYKPVVKVVLDENGNGSYNTATSDDQRFFTVE